MGTSVRGIHWFGIRGGHVDDGRLDRGSAKSAKPNVLSVATMLQSATMDVTEPLIAGAAPAPAEGSAMESDAMEACSIKASATRLSQRQRHGRKTEHQCDARD
jgi:hypothetical protein